MTVLITGASGGLGSVVAKAFLKGGNRVVEVAHQWSPREDAAAQVTRLTADLTRTEECARVVEEADAVDTLIHLVGGFAGGQPLSETSDETWSSMMAMNLGSAFRMVRAVLPGMLAAKYGRIAVIGSRAAEQPMANFAAYSVSKAALVMLVKTVALEVKDHGITVNAVLPSIIDTAANRAAMPKADFSQWVTPDAIAGTLLWLSSSAASDISGAAIPMYGRA